jgi:phage terminase large subunit
MYQTVPDSNLWPILGDADEERLIDHLAKEFGFQIRPCKKWPNSVLQGIKHLQSFEKIHVHKRCRHMAREARCCLWKRDRVGNLIEKPEDKNNHCWDAVRYALNEFIAHRGLSAVWARL